MGSLDDSSRPGIAVVGWAAKDKSGVMERFEYTLRETGAEDVAIKVLYCGICHSDLHQLQDDFGMSHYPMVAGHEVTGIVLEVGKNVSRLKQGDRVGVGCIVGACGSCDSCNQDMEQYCNQRKWTFNDVYYDGNPTYGGFASKMVVNQKFVVRIPDNLPLDVAAPLLCAGITVYSPMKFFGMTEAGKRCGVMGLGGVGHMAVKFAKAFGLHVTVISSSPKKEKEAREVLGADAFLVTSNEQQMKEAEQTLDYILDTVPAVHPLEPYLSLLRMNGKIVVLGVVPAPLQFITSVLILGRRSIGGSFIGGIKETQDMLDFASKKGIGCMIEVVSMTSINEAMQRLEKNDVRYRFVVDVGNCPLLETQATSTK